MCWQLHGWQYLVQPMKFRLSPFLIRPLRLWLMFLLIRGHHNWILMVAVVLPKGT